MGEGGPGEGLSWPLQPVRAIRALTASSFLFPLSLLAVTGFPKCICLGYDGPKEQCVLDEFRLRLQMGVENLSVSCRLVCRNAVEVTHADSREECPGFGFLGGGMTHI